MPALAAIGKYLIRAFITDPKGVLKFAFFAVMLPLVILALLFVAPLALFSHVPLIGEEQGIYQDIIKELKKETGIEVNINELIGIDTVLLEQEFTKANPTQIRELAWEFIEARQETRTRTVSYSCPTKTNPERTCNREEQYQVTVYYPIPFDTVLSNLVAKGKIKTEWFEDIKRYASGSADNDTKIDIDNLPVVTDGTFMRPATGRVTSGRGFRWGRMHQGVDIGAGGRTGVPIVASADGVVNRSQLMNGFGQVVMITHNVNGQLIETVYAHMVTGSRQVSVGQAVTKGQVLGIMGNTGNSTGPHLHFEVHIGPWNGKSTNAVDPMLYVQF